MKPIIDLKTEVRIKGGRANGGTRYYHSKIIGEDKMIRRLKTEIKIMTKLSDLI